MSKGNPFSDGPYTTPGSRPADYTPIDVHAGTTYLTVVERLSQIQAEEAFEKSLRERATERPDPDARWSRVKILKIAPDGAEEEALLEGAWFIFDARDGKMDGWAVGVDRDGYIHLVGGQHNTPNKRYYMPGSWEKMGLDGVPGVMYWVSRAPGDIGSFEFLGRREHPRTIPCGWMNYMNFARSPDGTLFLYGRDHIWTWGLYRYDAPTRQWTALGETPTAMLEEARSTVPEWAEYTRPVRSAIGPSGRRVLVCAWQPGAYNFNRSRWGVRFDRTGRMHIQVPIRGVGEAGRMSDGPIYAYSDDLGDRFHRADGTPLTLPLTVNPVPGYQADINVHMSRQWFDLWVSLLREAGYKEP